MEIPTINNLQASKEEYMRRFEVSPDGHTATVDEAVVKMAIHYIEATTIMPAKYKVSISKAIAPGVSISDINPCKVNKTTQNGVDVATTEFTLNEDTSLLISTGIELMKTSQMNFLLNDPVAQMPTSIKNKVFECKGHKFNIKCELNTRVEKIANGKAWHTLTLSILEEGNNWQQKLEVEHTQLPSVLADLERIAQQYADTKTNAPTFFNQANEALLTNLGFE